MRLFLQYLRGKAGKLAAFFLFTAIFIASFALYRLPLTAVWYPSALCLALGRFFCWISGASNGGRKCCG